MTLDVLVVDGAVPDREAAASDRAIIDLIDGLLTLGHNVTFCALVDEGDSAERGKALTARGATVAPGLGGRLAHLKEVAASRDWDVVIAQRPGTALTVTAALDLCPSAATIHWGHDIFAWRLRDQQKVCGDVNAHFRRIMELSEERSWDAYDLTVYPTTREANAINARSTSRARGAAMPYYRLTDDDLVDQVGTQRSRSGCLMVGTSAHAPNRDAVAYAANEILPLLQQVDPEAALTVVGDWPLPSREELERPGMTFLGRVSEAELIAQHNSHLCLLAPLRFGAGSRRKIVSAMGLGLPVVTTSEGIRGLLVRDAVPEDGVIVADEPQELADAVLALGRSPELWHTTVATALDSVADVYSAAKFDRALATVLDSALNLHPERSAHGSDSSSA